MILLKDEMPAADEGRAFRAISFPSTRVMTSFTVRSSILSAPRISRRISMSAIPAMRASLTIISVKSTAVGTGQAHWME